MADRVAIIHHGFIPDYRVRLYELLQEQGDLEYVVFHGQAPRGDHAAEGPFSFPNIEVTNREVRLGPKFAIYQPIIRRVMQDDFNALVLGTPLKLLANLPLFFAFRSRGRPVLLWGQGREKAELTGRLPAALSRVAAVVKELMARRADGYLVYTEAGREDLIKNAVAPGRIAVLRNTLDLEREVKLHRKLEGANAGELRFELGLAPRSVLLLYLGRVYPEKHVEDLCDLLRGLRDRGLAKDQVEVAVIGEGPAMASVRSRADGLSGLHLVGELRDPEGVARYLRISAAVVMPGKVGLAVNHALAHGVPVLTRATDLHATEIDYIESGVNGLIAGGGFESFVEDVATFVNSPRQQQRLALGALASRDGMSLESMAERFHAAVTRALSLSQGGLDGVDPEHVGQTSGSFDPNTDGVDNVHIGAG